MKALIAAMLGIAFSPFQTFATIGTPRGYDRSYKRPTPKPANNPVGTKLARKAAKGILTGNYRTRACQGIMRQFSARRGSASPV